MKTLTVLFLQVIFFCATLPSLGALSTQEISSIAIDLIKQNIIDINDNMILLRNAIRKTSEELSALRYSLAQSGGKDPLIYAVYIKKMNELDQLNIFLAAQLNQRVVSDRTVQTISGNPDNANTFTNTMNQYEVASLKIYNDMQFRLNKSTISLNDLELTDNESSMAEFLKKQRALEEMIKELLLVENNCSSKVTVANIVNSLAKFDSNFLSSSCSFQSDASSENNSEQISTRTQFQILEQLNEATLSQSCALGAVILSFLK